MSKGKSLKEEFELYTLEEVSEDFHLHVETIRRYVREGKLKAKKVGRMYLVHKSHIIDLFCPETNNKIQQEKSNL